MFPSYTSEFAKGGLACPWSYYIEEAVALQDDDNEVDRGDPGTRPKGLLLSLLYDPQLEEGRGCSFEGGEGLATGTHLEHAWNCGCSLPTSASFLAGSPL